MEMKGGFDRSPPHSQNFYLIMMHAEYILQLDQIYQVQK